MSGTQVTTNRYPRTTPESTVYEISAVCTLAGTLPDTHIFVYQAVDFEDPKDDVLYRVATANDFALITNDRETAITNNAPVEGSVLYRTPTLVQAYDSVDLATEAWTELSARINDLVVTYDAYITAFLTPAEGSLTTYPAVDESTKTALIAAYEAAAAAVPAAEQARDTENVACEALQLEFSLLQQQLADAQNDLTAVVAITGPLGSIAPSLTSVGAALAGTHALLTSQIASSTASAGEKAAMTGSVASAEVQVNVLNVNTTALVNNVVGPLSTLQGTLQDRVTDLITQVTAMQLEVNNCALEMSQLQGAVDAARTARDTALAAVRAVCTDFIPAA